MLRILLGLTFIFTLSCTEEISEELKNSSTSDALTDAEKFNGKTISLTHKMNEDLSYRIHKEGSSTLENCELASPTTGFFAKDYYQSLDDYAGADPQVINCVLDVQELDLWQNGAEVELQVDEFLCEYITYEPFKFYEFPMGRTDQVYYEISCADNNCDPACGNTYASIDLSGASPAFSDPIDVTSYTCEYNYSETGGPNCDSGRYRVVEYEMTGSTTPTNTCTGTFVQTSTVTETDCGGQMINCMGGPSVDILGDPTLSSEIYVNQDLESFTQSFSIGAPAGRLAESDNDKSNLYIANYSRICSNMSQTDKNDATDFNGISFEGKETENIWKSNNYSAVADSTDTFIEDENNTFIYTRQIGRFEYPDNSVDSTGFAFATTAAGEEYGAIGYSENPWRGAYRTSAYYSFKCLDKAFDTKAQIRLYIREWDREYDTDPSTSFARISDIFVGKYMDSDTEVTNDGDSYNNIEDWDDFWLNPNGLGTDVWTNNNCVETDFSETDGTSATNSETDAAFRRGFFPGAR